MCYPATMVKAAAHKQSADIYVTHEKALEDYLAMGCKRSLTKLAKHYEAQGIKSPALSTLKYWSGQYNWQVSVRAYDRLALAQETGGDALEEITRDDTFDAQSTLTDIIKTGLAKSLMAAQASPVHTLADAERMMKLVKEAMDLKDFLRNSAISHELSPPEELGMKYARQVTDSLKEEFLEKDRWATQKEQ